jgi:hypothetical protein
MGFLLEGALRGPGDRGRNGATAFTKADGNRARRFGAGTENHLITIL